MGTVYPLDAGRNLIIYESGNTLYIRTTIGEGLTRPVTLCTDFAGGLTDTVHKGTVYYCYVNTGHEIVVRSITDLQELYKIESRDTSGCMNPRLVSFQDTLLLFYVIQNPIDGAHCLKALFPFELQRHIMLPEKNFAGCPDVNIVYSENYMLVCAEDEASRLILYFDRDIRCSLLENPEELKQALADRDKEAAGLKQALADRDKEAAGLRQALADREEETEELKQALADCEEQLAGKDSVIENIKAQYEELMNTALKYKEEAARWYEIAHRRDARPIPGEHLITDSW
ncbi:MAG: ELKS/Rab6-interacting/CAST family protein [Butyrivibrio sp.]|nr:ELKS/Rab6-interacting/CAST family protein [Acetatifactor muris]MCM1558470.1 ELKS/Rab6-interacting/CAST family protein [Butyrivibrio sp.]